MRFLAGSGRLCRRSCANAGGMTPLALIQSKNKNLVLFLPEFLCEVYGMNANTPLQDAMFRELAAKTLFELVQSHGFAYLDEVFQRNVFPRKPH